MFSRGPSRYFGFITGGVSWPQSVLWPLELLSFSRLPGAGIVAFGQADNLSTLFNTMTDSIERWRGALPDFIAEESPVDVEELRPAAVAWLGLHAGALKDGGAEAGCTLAHIFVGLGIG